MVILVIIECDLVLGIVLNKYILFLECIYLIKLMNKIKYESEIFVGV